MTKQNVIIDCDPGIDDILALMYAIKHSNINVVAITLVAGNCPVHLGFKNVTYLLEILGRTDIPVYLGSEKPLKKEFVSAQDTHGEDGLGNNHFKTSNTFKPKSQEASNFLAEYFSIKKETSIIALGPLTNIAKSLKSNPDIGKNCHRFISMGGTYKTHGNCSPVSEYNYWCDPDAAKIVYQKLNRTIEMVGLDVTRKIVFSPNHLEYIKQVKPDQFDFISKITRFYFDFHWQYEHLLGCVINDPLAVAHFINENLCQGILNYTDISTTDITQGQTIVDNYNFYKKPTNALILTEVNTLHFWNDFLTTILELPSEMILNDLITLRLGE